MLQNLALALGSLAFSVYLGEACLVVWDGITRRPTILETVLMLSEAGQRAAPHLPRRDLLTWKGSTLPRSMIDGREIVPLADRSRTSTVACVESGRTLTYLSDGFGFHNPEAVWNLRRLTIAAVGDSFVQGFCVPPEHSLMAPIRRQYPAALNLGMGGSGPLSELAAIREYAASRRPEMVLWFFYEGNDLADLRFESASPTLMRYLEPDYRQALEELQPLIDQALGDYVEEWKMRRVQAIAMLMAHHDPSDGRVVKFAKANFWFVTAPRIRNLLRARFGGPSPNYVAAPTERDFDLFERVLRRSAEDVASWGGRLYFVYLASTAATDFHPDTHPAIHARVIGAANSLGLPVIDVKQELGPRYSDWRFAESHHLTPQGYEELAQLVLSRIAPRQ
ncbi:MAG: hypothetical protein HYR60_24710 [Acidobacteria bacterium]|nr:hypothetical protein [Acidobacteriota bacterium]